MIVPLGSQQCFFLQVEDVNDNAPEFVNLPYYAAVQVDAEPESAIFKVSAVDRDAGVNGEVSYSLKQQHRNFQARLTQIQSLNPFLLHFICKYYTIYYYILAGEPCDRRTDLKEGF